MDPIPTDKPILLFDGVCNLCNGTVRLLIRLDPHNRLRYASLQSETGKRLLELCEAKTVDPLPDTVVFICEGKCHTKTEAALRTLQVLGGAYYWFSRFLFWVPRSWRDQVYDLVSRNRHKWFGKTESCPLSTPENKHRFLPGG